MFDTMSTTDFPIAEKTKILSSAAKIAQTLTSSQRLQQDSARLSCDLAALASLVTLILIRLNSGTLLKSSIMLAAFILIRKLDNYCPGRLASSN